MGVYANPNTKTNLPRPPPNVPCREASERQHHSPTNERNPDMPNPMTITIEFRDQQEIIKMMEKTARIANSDLPLKKKMAQLKKLQSGQRRELADVPRLAIMRLEKERANGA